MDSFLLKTTDYKASAPIKGNSFKGYWGKAELPLVYVEIKRVHQVFGASARFNVRVRYVFLNDNNCLSSSFTLCTPQQQQKHFLFTALMILHCPLRSLEILYSDRCRKTNSEYSAHTCYCSERTHVDIRTCEHHMEPQ